MPSVRMNAQEKQPAFKPNTLEQAVLALEEAVFSVLDMNKGHAFHDVDFLYWNRRLKSVAMQLSLAMSEHRGPKRFHEHYRHDPKNYDALLPVAGPSPLVTLARLAREALTECADMHGIADRVVLRAKERLEQAVRGFLNQYHASQKELAEA